jgi:hypothetical protein
MEGTYTTRTEKLGDQLQWSERGRIVIALMGLDPRVVFVPSRMNSGNKSSMHVCIGVVKKCVPQGWKSEFIILPNHRADTREQTFFFSHEVVS